MMPLSYADPLTIASRHLALSMDAPWAQVTQQLAGIVFPASRPPSLTLLIVQVPAHYAFP